MSNTPVDHAAIQDGYNKCEIDKSSYDLLSKQLDDLATPEGPDLAAMKRAFVGAFKPVVDPNSPEAETEAAAQTIQLEKALSRKIDDMRASGKDPRDLFVLGKPDYLETPFKLVPQFIPYGAASKTPQVGPTEPEGATGGPQAPPDNPQPSTEGSNSSPPRKDNAPLTGGPTSGPENGGRLDPFERAAQVTRRSVMERHEGAGTDFFNRFMASTPEALKAWFEKGREVFGPPPAPAKPGFWSEEDEIRRQEFEQKKIEFAAQTALLLTTLFRTEGGLGAGPRLPGPREPAGPKIDGPPTKPAEGPSTTTAGSTKADLAPGPESPTASEGVPRPEPTTASPDASTERPPPTAPPHTPASKSRPEIKRTPKTESTPKGAKPNPQPVFDEHLSDAEFRKLVRSRAYRAAYQRAHPGIKIDDLLIHHGLPKQAFKNYRGVIPIAELHDPANLRGIPKNKRTTVHLKIHEMWDDFYEKHPTATARQLRTFAKRIDDRFGHHFVPPRGGTHR